MSENRQWYYSSETGPRGPVDHSGLRVLAEQGFVVPSSWVWRETWTEWQRLEGTELRDQLSFIQPRGHSVLLPPLPFPQGGADLCPPLPIPGPVKGQLRQFGFNLLVFCGAFAALAASIVPLFSSVSLPFSVPVTALAIVSLAWATRRGSSKMLPVLSLLAAVCAVGWGAQNYHAENQHKPTLTELLAIHDRGTLRP